jgi:hypothetical protein
LYGIVPTTNGNGKPLNAWLDKTEVIQQDFAKPVAGLRAPLKKQKSASSVWDYWF